MSQGRSTPTVSLSLLDLRSGSITPLEELTMVAAGLKERDDLQRWVTSHPDLIAPGLLLITTEFDRWEIREQKVADRLDALFVDTEGSPVVVEFKRDKATDTVELQALKYAAYCSQLTLDDLVEDLAATEEISTDESRALLVDHAPHLEKGVPAPVKVLLVAGGFSPAVTSVVLWLREYELDIRCIEISLRAMPDGGRAVLSGRQLLPLPEAEDYLVRHRRKEREEERARLEPEEWSWGLYGEHFPPVQLAIAKRVFDALERYVEDNELPWTPTLRSWWLGFKRPGGFYVPVINLRREKPIEFTVKLPASPEQLGLTSPYPDLESRWDAAHRQWGWFVPTLDDVPDVHAAVDISRDFQPERGPMGAAPKTPSPTADAPSPGTEAPSPHPAGAAPTV